MRIVKRSSCASGSGYVPSYSIGFCVAITMNGRPSSYDTPSIVTCCSCMHSSSAACVFGDARLISSTSRRFATSARTVSAASVVSTRSLPGSLTQQLLRPIYDRRGESVFRRLRESLFSARGDEHDLVLVGVEADVRTRDVVVDDEVDMLPLQLRACAREAVGSRFGSEADEHLAVRPSLAERLQDVGSRLELQPPRLCVLRALRAERLGGAVVRDRGGHQDKIGIAAGQRRVMQSLGGRRLDHLDAGGRGNGEIRREQGDLAPTLPRLLRERDAHLPRRAVAEETHRVERLTRPARAHQHVPPGERVALPEQLAAAAVDLVRLRHPPQAPFAFRRLALVWPDEERPAGT